MSIGRGYPIRKEDIPPPGGWNATPEDKKAAEEQVARGLQPDSGIIAPQSSSHEVHAHLAIVPEALKRFLWETQFDG